MCCPFQAHHAMSDGKEAKRKKWLTHDHRAEEGPLPMPEPSSLDQFHLNSKTYFGKGHKMIAHILSYCVGNSFKRRTDMFKSIHFQLCISCPKVRSIRHGINLQLDHLKRTSYWKETSKNKTKQNKQTKKTNKNKKHLNKYSSGLLENLKRSLDGRFLWQLTGKNEQSVAPSYLTELWSWHTTPPPAHFLLSGFNFLPLTAPLPLDPSSCHVKE